MSVSGGTPQIPHGLAWLPNPTTIRYCLFWGTLLTPHGLAWFPNPTRIIYCYNHNYIGNLPLLCQLQLVEVFSLASLSQVPPASSSFLQMGVPWEAPELLSPALFHLDWADRAGPRSLLHPWSSWLDLLQQCYCKDENEIMRSFILVQFLFYIFCVYFSNAIC